MIREERAADYDAVYSVVKCAFQSAAHSDGHEQELVAALRKSEAFVPELSLVAEIDGKIVGHILFSKLMVGTDTELALAPLSVLPAYQRRGIGLALIREGHRIAKALGYRYSVVLGSETYYPQAGYRRAENSEYNPRLTCRRRIIWPVIFRAIPDRRKGLSDTRRRLVSDGNVES